MAKFEIKAGASIDVLTQAELAATLDGQRPPYQAVSVIRLPVVSGVAAGGVLSFGGDSGGPTPDQGYVWAIRHLSIEGLTAGATPDVVNIIRAGRVFWKLSGAPPAAETWGRGEFMVNAGETLSFTNFGAFVAAGPIIVSGTAWQCPAQFVAELAL